jgi:hypothetical protein
MSKKFLLLALIIFSGLFAVITPAFAQNYSIDWYKISGGGGASSGGQYSVSGTIGQHDAGGPMSGGNFSLTGGFWSLISVVQTPGSPVLIIQVINPTTVRVLWPYPSASWTLQQNPNIGTTNWSATGFSVSNDGTNNSVTISPPTGNLFFRLNHP